MLKIVSEHINANFLFLKGKKLLIACSGGLDSVVMCHLFNDMKFTIGLAHCNFSLRGKESDGDETFVADLAERLNIPVYSERFNTKKYAGDHKISTQMAARELRYRWFEEVRTDFKYDYVLTAHHADDELETFLINLSRGTGIRGLTGIRAHNKTIVRPLLPLSREQLFAYAKHSKLHWREDSSNAKTEYLRNALRHDVIPPYKKQVKMLLHSVQKTQKYLTDSALLLDDYLALIYQLVVTEIEDGYSIDIQKISDLPNTEALLYELLRPFGFTAWEDISDLLKAQSGKQILSKTHRLIKNRDNLLLTAIPSEEKTEELFISENTKKIDVPITLSFNSIDKIGHATTTAIFLDNDKLKYPLKLRKWREGDIFQPFGMQGKKKLSKFFKDEKLSLVAKKKTWVLSSDEQIVWVIGCRADDRFKVTPQTTNILKISCNN